MSTPGFLAMLREMVKQPDFDITKNYLEAKPYEYMRFHGVLCSTEMISALGKITDEQWREGWSAMRSEGLLPK